MTKERKIKTALWAVATIVVMAFCFIQLNIDSLPYLIALLLMSMKIIEQGNTIDSMHHDILTMREWWRVDKKELEIYRDNCHRYLLNIGKLKQENEQLKTLNKNLIENGKKRKNRRSGNRH